jgi:hypothetical protein
MYKKSEHGKSTEKSWAERNPHYKLIKNLRTKHNDFVRYNIKGKLNYSTTKSLGCKAEEFKLYIESLFTNEMTWDNYGVYWEMDHIFPLSKIDLKNNMEIELATHFLNIRPLEKNENLKKSDSIVVDKEEHFNKIIEYKKKGET